jgi:DNA invertase Pin-like site-specific DNA recombinase
MSDFPTSPVAYSYIRFSHADQAKGDSLRRQTAAAESWCRRNNVRLDTSTTFRDLGRSAYVGEHRKNPDRHDLARFLKLVEAGKVPKGSFLIIENLDRLTREHIQPALLLALGLLQAGVRIVQLKPAELVFDDKSDTLPVMMMMMELSRGHGESAIKSERLGAAWDAKRANIRARKLTGKAPFWLRLAEDGASFVERPEAVALVRRVYRLAREGEGSFALARRLNEEGILSPYRKAWNNVSVLWLLRNRAVVGEYTPHRVAAGRREPAGPPVPDYYPAIISEQEFWAVQEAIKGRKNQRGRRGKGVPNLFTELLRDARDGAPMHRVEKRKGDPRLVSYAAIRGKDGAEYVSFPFVVFERAVLSLLSEVDPREVLGQPDGPDEALALSGELARVEGRIAELEAELEGSGDVTTLAKVLRKLEGQKRDLADRLAEARQKAASPLSEAWGEAKSLLTALDGAADREDARLRLRSALRRIVSEVRVLVVPQRHDRLAAVQILFAGSERRRDYLILYRSPKPHARPPVEARWWARSLSHDAVPGELDLRRPEHVERLEKALLALDLAAQG